VSRRTRLLGGWALALALAATCVALGSWQLGRRDQKQAMLDEVAQVLERRDARPLAVAADPARLRGYDWAAGAGVFSEAPAVLLDNQQRAGRPGVRAYRAFDPDDGPPLLVELGWLPVPGDRTMPEVPRPPGRHRVEGLLAPRPSGGIGHADAVPQDNGVLLTIGLDAANLAPALGRPQLAPRILKLDPALPLGYARDLDILPNTLPPERHLGYVVQWFALALAVLATALVLTLRRLRP
jgi:surfeit locus 1 family protein